MSAEEEEEEMTVVPGMLLDAMNRIVLTILSDDQIGVSLDRFDAFPEVDEIVQTVKDKVWITVYKDSPLEIYLMRPKEEEDSGMEDSPQANESAQFALELAMAHWPDWAPGLEKKYEPKVSIRFPLDFPEA